MSDDICLGMNLINFATTQYCNYQYNAFCKLGSKYFASNDTGVYELGGNTDPDGNITAMIELPLSMWGVETLHRIRSLIFDYFSDGDLEVNVEDSNGNIIATNLYMSQSGISNGVKLNIGRTLSDKYFKVIITNINGCDFSVDKIIGFLIVLGKES